MAFFAVGVIQLLDPPSIFGVTWASASKMSNKLFAVYGALSCVITLTFVVLFAVPLTRIIARSSKTSGKSLLGNGPVNGMRSSVRRAAMLTAVACTAHITCVLIINVGGNKF